MAKKSKPRKPKKQHDAVRAAEKAAFARRKRQRRLLIIAVIGVVAMIAPIIATLLIEAGDDNADAPTETQPTLDIIDLPAPPPGAILSGPTPCPELDGSSERTTGFVEAPPDCLDADASYRATLTTDQGDIVIELDMGEYAAANTFGVLGLYHFYDGLPFHFVLDEGLLFAGATGDPVGTGAIPFEVPAEPDSSREYVDGTVAMLVNLDVQFDTRFLISGTDDAGVFLSTPDHPIIGEVVEGLDVIDTIAASGEATGIPTEVVTIDSLTITRVGSN